MPISLFYYYTPIPDVESLASRLRPLGQSLDLAGRIRLSSDGINATCGGNSSAVQQFHSIILSELGHPSIDFKLAEGSKVHFPEGWIVRICKELVTLGVPSNEASWRDAAPHLTPEEFRREVLAQNREDTVLLDVRNEYEHAIGRFKGALLPPIRQFSDFPKYVRDNGDLFADKRVLMYCTGGVRCETASAYMKNVGGAKSVMQLRGGIDRFIKAYPDGGGLFEGKNLVFDKRMAVGTTCETVVGKCIHCGDPWDDYSSNWRCSRCRCRLLICHREDCAVLSNESGVQYCPACQRA